MKRPVWLAELLLATSDEPGSGPESTVHTDEFIASASIGKQFTGGHKKVNHSLGQYVSEGPIGTNTAESYFALLKRGAYGYFHHVCAKHLFRYCVEFDFRWNNREMKVESKTIQLLGQVSGKRLLYKESTANTGVQEITRKERKPPAVATLKPFPEDPGIFDINIWE